MNIATTNAAAKVAAVAAGLGLVFSSVMIAPAKADTTEDLNAQLQALLAQVAALQAQLGVSGDTGSTGSTTFTMDLTIGSTGAEVTALQNWLISQGQSIPAGATGYFGTQTQAALAAWQAANGIAPAVGYFGPITRAKVNGMGGGSTGGTGTDTGSGSDSFLGGDDEGYLDEFEQLSSYASEEVGEDEEDVPVLGVEMEAQDADQMIERVTVVFDTPTSNDDLEDFISDVSLWLDGDELDRMDIEDCSYDSGDDEYTCRFTGLEGVVAEGEVAELVVGVTGVSNVDSDDEGDGWDVNIPIDGIRAVSPNGVDDVYDSGAFDEPFTVESFASANDVELMVTEADDSPESTVVDVSTTDDTDGVELLVAELEAEGSDITVTEIPVNLQVSGDDDVDGIVNRLTLEIDGEEYSETVSTSAANGVVTFDDLDIEIADGDMVSVRVLADINDTEGSGASAFDDGDTVTAALRAIDVVNIEAEDESGEDLTTADLTGTALGDPMAFYDVGVMVSLVSVDETLTGNDGNDNDTGTFEIKVNVEAFDGTAYVASSTAATTDDTVQGSSIGSNLYFVDENGTATVALLAQAVSYTTGDGASLSTGAGNIELADGESTELTFTITRTNGGFATDDGLFRALLAAIGWNTGNSATVYNIYNFDFEDYKTDYINVN